MTRRAGSRRLAATALGAAAVLLVGSAGWAVFGGDDDGWHWARLGAGMMAYAPVEGDGSPVRDMAAARRQADRLADRLDLRVGEVMQFENHFYAELLDGDARATEVLVDERTGAVTVEPGPAMMWNTRYGMLAAGAMGSGGMMGAGMMGGGGMMGAGMMGAGGMMGGAAGYGAMMPGGTLSPARDDDRDLSSSAARAIAGRWLRANARGLTVGEADAFPGYFTLHTLRSGRVSGMLSVNASSGDVWPHWWHSRFVGMS